MPATARNGAIFWVLTAQFFAAQFIAQSAWQHFSLVHYDISLLGITTCDAFPAASSGNLDVLCSPLHMVFNAGIILHGVCAILGVWYTRSLWPPGRSVDWALLLLALGGIGAVMVGAYPLNAHIGLHVLGAVTAIGAPGIGLLLLGLAEARSRPAFAAYTLLTAAIILAGGLAHATGLYPIGRGTVERLAVWPQTLWYITASVTILAGQRRAAGGKLVLGHVA